MIFPTCARRSAAGQACTELGGCEAGSECAPDGDALRSQPPGQAGARCLGDVTHPRGSCVAGLICDTTITPAVCAPRKAAGERCGGPGTCETGLT